LGISLVGATVEIVYGPAGATCAGGSAQAPGSVRSRTYIWYGNRSLPPQISCLPASH
jgi:hypothetical protein